MKFIQIVLLVLIAVSAYAGKVTWNEDGKPIMSATERPIEGCSQGGFESIVKDKNSSSNCS